MLQRAQTLFLLGVVLIMAASLFFPMWQEIDPDTQESLTMHAWYNVRVDTAGLMETVYVPYLVTGILTIITCVVALVEIFKYTNRPLQLKLSKLNSLFLMATLGILFYLVYNQEDQIVPNDNGDYQAGMVLPIMALVLNLVAGKFISKDEKLVRSVDRIR